MRATRVALVAVVASAACGGGGSTAPVGPKEPTVDERKAEKAAKDVVDELHDSIASADTDSMMSLLAVPLVVFGPRRGDAMTTRADALVALRGIFDPKAKPKFKSEDLAVVASEGGHSAFAVDLVDLDGQSLAITAVLSETGEIWSVTAAAVAHTPAMKTVRAELKKDAVVPIAMTAGARVEGGARGAVERFTKGVADLTLWGEDLATRSDSVVVGPSAGDLTRGKKDIKHLFTKRAKAKVRQTVAGEITAATTPDGKLAWVTAPVVRFAEDDEPLPLRIFAIYAKVGSDWKMTAVQESLALDEPGAGAGYKKTAPPAEKAAPPPPPPKVEPKKKPKPKPKKKKKDAEEDE